MSAKTIADGAAKRTNDLARQIGVLQRMHAIIGRQLQSAVKQARRDPFLRINRTVKEVREFHRVASCDCIQTPRGQRYIEVQKGRYVYIYKWFRREGGYILTDRFG